MIKNTVGLKISMNKDMLYKKTDAAHPMSNNLYGQDFVKIRREALDKTNFSKQTGIKSNF